ncbi:MAG TPA: hypothetical protein PLT37_09730 [Kiritimatiellia bacterium]|jgi:hypothetical protein|nr:hypothetical protein [Kiritimatiellia bacterium]OQC56042.1 MAG: hypothetical protein BWX54_01589 [Verrucomicrobia bacterium ADurb.Bin018]MBP9572874.1 hypothetical protein [Kiritimatiellia bacterium]HOE01232.1 hypothetical protein [Kiritimatiellia bacterium]HOR75184.1 hypothetical protein [Kiritimatiellia bacterium]
MKKILLYVMIGLMMTATVGMAQGRGKGKAEQDQASGPVTHPQLAELLVRTLGLLRFLPAAPTSQQLFDILMQNGIVPEKGWELSAVVSKGDLARVLVQAMKAHDMVENPNDPQAWIDALKSLGISLDRLSETIQSVETLPNPMGQDITVQSADPLIFAQNFTPGGTIQYTVDLNLVTRVFTELQMINGEFRPIRPTPH